MVRASYTDAVTVLEFSDSILIGRGRDEIYALVSDVTRMGEWSPQCRACWWDDPATGPVVGAWFTGRNETAERTWETRSQVVVADPGRAFAWEVNDGWVRWGFTVDDADAATRLTQSWVFLPRGIVGFGERYGPQADTEIAIRSRAAVSGIPVTLAAIKATAEQGG
ncbi:polyketide cyclase/dehydrase and lipid transport [Mycolicibacterium cosmeticum]|uniref:Polyketide cyclase/dehydrase and lipid transport n=1 Tax=Mycolicibacterium cosmeticum TaxID=258533 RepID=W9B900_MYCCO|nr:polyketide cyclase/dehydrase and lipid transport [Mycolicibacterium cosmeticum]